MAGYSATPLSKKLGLKTRHRVLIKNAPPDYHSKLKPLPPGIIWLKRMADNLDVIQIFAQSAAVLERSVAMGLKRLNANGMIWASWPKKASKVPTDITEDVVRRIALPMGLVDVKVCAVDEIWSGLKLVIRKENR